MKKHFITLTQLLFILLILQITAFKLSAQINPSTTGPIGSQLAFGINEDIKYWNGLIWVAIPSGLPGQILKFNSDVPSWENNLNGIITTVVTNITGSTAISGGNISSSGGSAITARGICWSISHNPTLLNTYVVNNSSGKGNFTCNLTNLIEGATYYIRAFATNSAGTVYGNEISFVALNPSKVYDVDGYSYDTVHIGAQVWLKQNLKTTKYRNGNAIPNVTDNTSWSGLTSGAYCNYNNDVALGNTYGRLYNFYTVVDARNLCPAAWHVPTDEEFYTLINYLGGSSVAGGKLKEIGTAHWNTPNTGATNETAFTAIPGGYRFIYGSFNYIGTYSQFWTSTEANATNSFYYYIVNNSGSIYTTYYNKSIGFSVRCIKN